MALHESFPALLRRLREEAGMSQSDVAAELCAITGTATVTRHEVSRWERGTRRPAAWLPALAIALRVPLDELTAAAIPQPPSELASHASAALADRRYVDPTLTARLLPDGDEIDALELSRRVAASDVSEETLMRLELTVDDLAVSYASMPPAELLLRLRRHLDYVGRLLDGKKTLSAHRRLLVAGGWLSLLAATCHVDLHQRSAATARLRTAAQLAQHAEHPEITAWCIETQAWQALTDGDYRQAVVLSQAAQEIAPAGSSAYIQATAQEGRAWARLSAGPETHALLDRVARLASSLAVPDRPEHHYHYDPAKADAYTATTLSWLGDPAAEPYARRVLARLESPTDGPPRPRRAASARLDLSLALVAADKPDEAVEATLTAVTSGVLVPSNYWRASEVIAAVETRGVPEVAQLREAYRELCAGT